MTLAAPERLVGPLVTLRRYTMDDVAELKDATNSSYEELKDWMVWSQDPATDETVTMFLESAVAPFGGDNDAQYAITLTETGAIVGSCGLHHRPEFFGLEIGYWVDTRHTGRGVATEAARLLTELALENGDRVVIRNDVGNTASARVAEKLGYRLDQVRDVGDPITRKQTGRENVWLRDR